MAPPSSFKKVRKAALTASFGSRAVGEHQRLAAVMDRAGKVALCFPPAGAAS